MSPSPQHASGISVWKKLLFSTIVFVGFFSFVEGMLILVGVGGAAVTSDPYVGFSNQHPLFVPDESLSDTHVRTADNKLVWFNDQRFRRMKPAGVRRVFCVGGSTTFGRPYNDTTSFCGWLRELLPLADSSVKWEVINAGGVSYASYRVAAVMDELSQYQPDLFVVYTGQNEFLERRTYAGMFDQSQWQRNVTALLAKTRTFAVVQQWVSRDSQSTAKSSRRVMLPGEVDEILNHTVGPADYHRDSQWHSDVLAHYQANLSRMTSIAREAGAAILFIVPASNEKDCSPFKSELSSTLRPPQRTRFEHLMRLAESAEDSVDVVRQLRAARQIDDGYAAVDFMIGKRLFESGSIDEAAASFQTALDHDVCPLRATSSIRSSVRDLSSDPEVMIVDFDDRLRHQNQAAHGHGILGNESFLDHVHPTTDVHQQLARWILEELQSQRWIAENSVSQSQIARIDREVRARIDKADHGVALRNLAKVIHWSGKYDEAIPRARDALRLLPDDPESLLVLADCLRHTNEIDEAIATSEQLLNAAPMYSRGYLLYGELLFDQHRYDQAEKVLSSAAWMLPPESDRQLRALYLLGVTYLHQHDFRQADPLLSRVHRSYPDDLDTMSYLAQVKVGLGETAAAIEIYRLMIQHEPKHVDSHHRLGMLFMKDGRFDEAQLCFEKVLSVDPDNADAKVHLEITHQLLKRIDGVRE